MLSTFKIFDLESQEIEFETIIYDKELSGRLESGMYTFVGGHYYYNNNVIKIRYDLILNNRNIQYAAEDILTTYKNCFILEPNERVRTDTPLNSYQSHRLAFIITDKLKEKPLRVLIVPHLHERRIYMNRMKPSTEYFYTTVETSYTAEDSYHKAINMAIENGEKVANVDIIAYTSRKPDEIIP